MITVSKKVEYSVILISYLSKNKDKNISLTEVAERLKLPYRFLGQLATDLKEGGIVESQEGKSGGFRLVENWEKKSLYDLLEALGENKAMVTCLGHKGCERMAECRMVKMWEKIGKSWGKELKKVKLNEI